MEKHTVSIHGVSIAPGDIVFIKFKKLEEVLKDERKNARVNEILDHYQIDNHTNTFLKGAGHFKVCGVRHKNGYLRLSPDNEPLRKKSQSSSHTRQQEENEKRLEEIEIVDHNIDCNWDLNEILIEEIRVDNDHAETYFSERHEISLVRIDSTLFLNGYPITTADSKIFEMFEKVLADVAISKMFETSTEENNDDDDE